MVIFQVLTLVFGLIGFLMIMVASRHMGNDDPPSNRMPRLDIWGVRHHKAMWPPKYYKMHVSGLVMFYLAMISSGAYWMREMIGLMG